MKKPQTQESYRTRVRQAYLLIASNLDKPLELAALAEAMACSRYHFHRIYRSLIGETVVDTHRRLRLERAAGQIARTRVAITAVALDAGYETPQAFTRAFRQQFGLAPSAYRNGHNAPPDSRDRLPQPPIIMETINMNISIENRAATTVYGISHIGPYVQIGQAFGQLWEWVTRNNLAAQARAGIGIYYDDPATTPAAQCRAEACIEIEGSPSVEMGPVRAIEIPAGRYARYRHTGPYTTLEQAYQTLYAQWLPSSGHECADAPCFEVYINDPQQTPADKLITDIYVPLKGE